MMEERVLTPTMERLMAQTVEAERNKKSIEAERDRLKAENERLQAALDRVRARVQRVSALCVVTEDKGEDYLAVSAVFAALLEGAP